MNGFQEQPQTGLAGGGETPEYRSTQYSLKLGPGGRVVIPAEVRAQLNVKEGDVLLADFDGVELRLRSVASAVLAVQQSLKHLKTSGESVTDEFLAERRRLWGEED